MINQLLLFFLLFLFLLLLFLLLLLSFILLWFWGGLCQFCEGFNGSLECQGFFLVFRWHTLLGGQLTNFWGAAGVAQP